MKDKFSSAAFVLAFALIGGNSVSAMNNINVRVGDYKAGNWDRDIDIEIGSKSFRYSTMELAQTLLQDWNRATIRLNDDITLALGNIGFQDKNVLSTKMTLKCGKMDIRISHPFTEYEARYNHAIMVRLNSDKNDNITINAGSNRLEIRANEEADHINAKSINVSSKDVSLIDKIECTRVKALCNNLYIIGDESDMDYLTFKSNSVRINIYNDPATIFSIGGEILAEENSEESTKTECFLSGLLNVHDLELKGFKHTLIGKFEEIPVEKIIRDIENANIEINNGDSDAEPLENLVNKHLG